MDYILNYGLVGAKQSPEDSRDWLAESIYSTSFSLPIVLDHRNNLQPIRDQGEQGTCAAQTAACMKEWQELKDVSFNQYMSPQFIYNNRENQDSEGMYGRDVMRILSKVGSCSETSYPYQKIEDPNNILHSIKEEALNYKIKSYAQIKTLDSLKRALYINGPCYISFPVYNHGIRMWKPNYGDEKQGGHAMTVVGYNKDGFIIRNSWGRFWGDRGYTLYPYEDWGSHWECWTTIDASSYLEPKQEDEEPEPVKRKFFCFF